MTAFQRRLLLSDLDWYENLIATWKRSAQTWSQWGDCHKEVAEAKKMVRTYRMKMQWVKQRLTEAGVQV